MNKKVEFIIKDIEKIKVGVISDGKYYSHSVKDDNSKQLCLQLAYEGGLNHN